MTSLSNQLKRLRAPQTDEYRQVKYRESFLYDRKEASSIDCDTHFRIAQRGLSQLIEHNESLEEFQDSLFSEASKRIERATLNDEEQEQLSDEIRRFINCTIAPFFMLSACHETFEYLVYKYKVHMYQWQDVLLALLPYHGTRSFARALLMFKEISNSPNWQWLKVYQDKGLPVPRSKIISALSSRSSAGLLTLFGDKLMEVNKHTPKHADKLTSFYTATIIGCIARNVDDSVMISKIIPYNVKAIKKCYNLGLFLAGLTIFSYLIYAAGQIDQEYLLKMANKLSKSYLKLIEDKKQRYMLNDEQKTTLRKAFALCIVTLCDNQDIDEDTEISETLKSALEHVDIQQYEQIADCSNVYTKLANAFE